MSEQHKPPSGRMVALIRGINVGKAKRVAMDDLREIVEALGYRDVRTLLNSGNIVFTAPRTAPRDAAARIEKGLADRTGISARVTVITSAELAAVVKENPLLGIGTNHSLLLVAFLAGPADRAKLLPFAKQDWGREAFALGARVAYLWCPDGSLASRPNEALSRTLGDAVTTRNWATVTKLHGLL